MFSGMALNLSSTNVGLIRDNHENLQTMKIHVTRYTVFILYCHLNFSCTYMYTVRHTITW